MERKKSFLLLTICTLLLVSISQVVNATTYTSSSETNIALNPSRSGYPNPLESVHIPESGIGETAQVRLAQLVK